MDEYKEKGYKKQKELTTPEQAYMGLTLLPDDTPCPFEEEETPVQEQMSLVQVYG